ncbi:hypothetical protein Glove_87g159 [Diversispora epigaea]|uniref:Uncharacterized protein n=1 Tax=Diversispora epigaea TaxID=1348612 RepID=A0A397J672_9GLOM|nr:hypothetical protein Glove_87g159 [Diversispora epigaea]
MFCLVANKKNNSKELFEALQEIIKNRENLNNNKNNDDEFIGIYECLVKMLSLSASSEIDKGMFCLVANKKNNSKELFEALQEIIKNRENLNNNKNNDDGDKSDDLEIMKAIIQKSIEEYLAYKNYALNVPRFIDETCLNQHPLFTENDQIRKKKIRRMSFFQLLEEENEESLVGPI